MTKEKNKVRIFLDDKEFYEDNLIKTNTVYYYEWVGGIELEKVMQEYADQQTKDKDKEIEELKDENVGLIAGYRIAQEEITQLKQQLKEKSEGVEMLKGLIERAFNTNHISEMDKHHGWQDFQERYLLNKQ